MNQPAHDPFDTQAQAAAELDGKERAKIRARIELEDLRWVMSNKRGRRFIYSVMERAGVVGTLESFFNMNALKMAFNEGLSVEGKNLHNTLTTQAIDLYSLMLKEHRDDDN